jgi:hypothetical protein
MMTFKTRCGYARMMMQPEGGAVDEGLCAARNPR